MKKTVRDIDLSNKRVLVRVDYNVPMEEKTAQITDDSRIKASIPTIQYLLENKAIVVLCSHLGRPDGRRVPGLSLKPIANRLSEIISKPVIMAGDCIGEVVEDQINKLKQGDIIMMENLRFYLGEEQNTPEFAYKLSRLCDIFVNDAFGTAHRAHASTTGICKYVPSVAGLLLEKELYELGRLVESPQHPFCCLVGGAKVSDKIGLLCSMLSKLDFLLIGGGMAATFLAAKEIITGKSRVESDKIEIAKNIIDEAKKRGVEIQLPVDVVVARTLDDPSDMMTVLTDQIPADYSIVDIGPKSLITFSQYINKSKTVLWNGPLGICEIPAFAEGTEAIARLLSQSNAATVIGGGSTAEIVEKMGLTKKMTHVSTGGGASLSFLEGKELPGVSALTDK